MKYGIIGYPVEHSLSPVMHEAGFRELGIDAQYHRIPLHPTELAEGLAFLLELGYSGINVTYPLKEAVLPFLDKVNPQASEIGAVNTIKVVDGGLQGYNTDGDGFVQALKEQGYDFTGRKVVILGAGGSAKSIAASLAHLPIKEILILNRTEEKARILVELVHSLGGQASGEAFISGDWLKKVDLLIQTTSVGMRGESYPLSLQGINPSAWVIDLIYHPPLTKFLAEAESLGCRTMNGLDMLIWQGALAWKIWLDREAPVAQMRRALLDNYIKRG
ncbi:MAG: shikimate dehydrogenase [Gracilibacter sp. BRH_c7a]|nr:MAG: shikimate dehydrogenase [Gracilibacter sp. BRH_c7a]